MLLRVSRVPNVSGDKLRARPFPAIRSSAEQRRPSNWPSERQPDPQSRRRPTGFVQPTQARHGQPVMVGSTPPFEQFSFQRNERPQYRPSEQGDVLRKQQGAEREHPESQHRKETKIPKMINSNPTGTRTQRDDDPLSQRRKPPAPLGSSRDIRSISRSSRSASRSRIAALFYKIALRARPGRSSEHRDDRLGQFDQILLLQIE